MSIKKYFKIWKKYVEMAFVNAMEYRLNFLFGGLFETFWYAMNLVYFNVIFSYTNTLGGWTKYQVFFLVFYCALIDNIFGFNFWGGITQIPELIRLGTMDFIIIKPINIRYQLSLKYINCSQIYNLVFDIVGISYISFKLGIFQNYPYRILFLIIFVLNSVFVLYNFYFIMFTLCFWVVEASSLRRFSQDVFTIGNKPINIYPKIIQTILTYIVPFGIIFSLPAQLFMKGYTAKGMLRLFIVSILFFAVSQIFFKISIKRYTSASS